MHDDPRRVAEHDAWKAAGACAGEGPDFFFAPAQEGRRLRLAREAAARERFCDRCVVLDECRAYARRHGEQGFWGGESEEDRAMAGYPPRFRLPASTDSWAVSASPSPAFVKD